MPAETTPVTARSIAPKRSERRKEPRYDTHAEALVTRLVSNDDQPFAVQVLDSSRSGLRIRTHSKLEAGVRVRVNFNGIMAYGVARWTRPVSDGGAELNEAGIEIDHVVSHELLEGMRRAARESAKRRPPSTEAR